MATHRISILGLATPGGNANVIPRLLEDVAGNDLWKGLVYEFGAGGSAQNLLAIVFRVPKNYVGTPKIVASWASVPTSGNVVWDVDYRAIAAGESLDPSTWQESVTSGAVAASASALLAKETIVALTGANLAVDDTVLLHFSRDKSDAADTMAGAAYLLDLELEFVDA